KPGAPEPKRTNITAEDRTSHGEDLRSIPRISRVSRLRSFRHLRNHHLERFLSWMRRQLDRVGRLFQGKLMRDEPANIQFVRKYQPRDFLLKGEISRVAADEILLVHTNLGEVEVGLRS